MLTIENLQQLRAAYNSGNEDLVQDWLSQFDNPTSSKIIEAALAGLSSEDRNIRVMLLRILNHHPNAKSMQGILQGLHDDQRRVRDVAVQCSKNFVHFPEITTRLAEMATDDAEKKKIRQRALSCLAGGGAPILQGELPRAAAEALATLSQSEKYRTQILFGLLQLDYSDLVEELLQEFIQSGTKQEAVMATKALCGYKIVNIGHIEDEAQRNQILQTCDLAAGRVFYWVKRGDV